MPSVAGASKVMFLSTSSRTRLNTGRPASTPSSLATSLPRALSRGGNSAWLVGSPSAMSSASASLISLSSCACGNRKVTTGAGLGGAAGGGGGGGGGPNPGPGGGPKRGPGPGGKQGTGPAEPGGSGGGATRHSGPFPAVAGRFGGSRQRNPPPGRAPRPSDRGPPVPGGRGRARPSGRLLRPLGGPKRSRARASAARQSGTHYGSSAPARQAPVRWDRRPRAPAGRSPSPAGGLAAAAGCPSGRSRRVWAGPPRTASAPRSGPLGSAPGEPDPPVARPGSQGPPPT